MKQWNSLAVSLRLRGSCAQFKKWDLDILDEPTTGLHTDDVKRLLAILNKLVDGGNTMIIIEHNLHVIKSADWVIDMGPEGGMKGGEVVAVGTPEDLARHANTPTGEYLRKYL